MNALFGILFVSSPFGHLFVVSQSKLLTPTCTCAEGASEIYFIRCTIQSKGCSVHAWINVLQKKMYRCE